MHPIFENEQHGDLYMFHLYFPTRKKAINVDVLLCVATKCSTCIILPLPLPPDPICERPALGGVAVGQPCTVKVWPQTVMYSVLRLFAKQVLSKEKQQEDKKLKIGKTPKLEFFF